uniref:Uncharacterized protein n=1 Tax=Nelumbo nucifera TaxID=4432 RepID=A0A822YVC3_NELNU|nr:TPA_asm: hypothetical protein HUJ06_007147 [Nelumbo nucifera]
MIVVPEISCMLDVRVEVGGFGPKGSGFFEIGSEPGESISIVGWILDPTMEMDDCWDSTRLGNGSGNGWIPWEYVLFREVIFPRHISWYSLDGFNCGARYGGGLPRCPVREHSCCRQITVEFPFLLKHAYGGMCRSWRPVVVITETIDGGHSWEFIDEHFQGSSHLMQD